MASQSKTHQFPIILRLEETKTLGSESTNVHSLLSIMILVVVNTVLIASPIPTCKVSPNASV